MTDQPADDEQIARTNLAAVMRLARSSPYGDVIADQASRRRRLYDLLADSDDPLWKEIGTQLRDGQLGLRDIFGADAYRTHLVETIEKHGSDFPTMLANAREQLEADQRD